MFYASFTQLLGFERGDEYTGLAAYGEPTVNLDQSMDVSKDIGERATEFLNTNNRNLHQLVFNDALRDRYPTYLGLAMQKLSASTWIWLLPYRISLKRQFSTLLNMLLD